jgi:hypothetical protein
MLKLFQESGEGDWGREVKGVNSNMIYLIHCKNLCKCYPYPAQGEKTNQSNKTNKKLRYAAQEMIESLSFRPVMQKVKKNLSQFLGKFDHLNTGDQGLILCKCISAWPL